jgi:hypothetical protein
LEAVSPHPRAFPFFLATALSAVTAAAQPLPFEGKWAMKAELCQAGEGQPPPVHLTARRLDSPTMSCEFSSVLPGGVSYRVAADCTAGKERGHEFFTFAKLGDLLYWSWGTRTEGFVRCPD